MQNFGLKGVEIDATCGLATNIIQATTTTVEVTTTTPDLCCPDFSDLDPEVCVLLCTLVYGRKKRGISLRSSNSTDAAINAMEEAYILLFSRISCIQEGN